MQSKWGGGQETARIYADHSRAKSTLDSGKARFGQDETAAAESMQQ